MKPCFSTHGRLSKLWSPVGSPTYLLGAVLYYKEAKRDHNLDNHPYGQRLETITFQWLWLSNNGFQGADAYDVLGNAAPRVVLALEKRRGLARWAFFQAFFAAFFGTNSTERCLRHASRKHARFAFVSRMPESSTSFRIQLAREPFFDLRVPIK